MHTKVFLSVLDYGRWYTFAPLIFTHILTSTTSSPTTLARPSRSRSTVYLCYLVLFSRLALRVPAILVPGQRPPAFFTFSRGLARRNEQRQIQLELNCENSAATAPVIIAIFTFDYRRLPRVRV